jgi:hypothetical protein
MALSVPVFLIVFTTAVAVLGFGLTPADVVCGRRAVVRT